MIYKDMHGKSIFRLKRVPSSNIDMIAIFDRLDKVEAKKAQKKSQETETDIRDQVQKIITEGVFYGTPILQILEKLNSNEKYKKYSEYFEQWINDRKNKKEEMIRYIKQQKENGITIEELIEKTKYSTKFKNYGKYYLFLLEEQRDLNKVEKDIQSEQEEK